MSILALHGFTGCGEDFAPFAELCGEEWHHPNLPGHGKNSKLSSTPNSMLEFVQQQSRYSRPQIDCTNHILCGYSMGARAALLHATQYPQTWDALILISGTPGIITEQERDKRRQADRKLAHQIETQGVASFLDFWQQTSLIRSQQTIRASWRDAMQANRLQHRAVGLANNLRQFGQGSMPNLWPKLNQLKIPVCLITGEVDKKYTKTAKQILACLDSPLCSHTVIPNASHMPHLEQCDASAIAVRAFIEQIQPSQS